jgi:hypothetical protein
MAALIRRDEAGNLSAKAHAATQRVDKAIKEIVLVTAEDMERLAETHRMAVEPNMAAGNKTRADWHEENAKRLDDRAGSLRDRHLFFAQLRIGYITRLLGVWACIALVFTFIAWILKR